MIQQDAFPRGLGLAVSCNRTKFDRPLTTQQVYYQLGQVKSDWWYDYGYLPAMGQWPDHPEWGPRYVPMMFFGWEQWLAKYASKGKALLCLNEPDQESQANMSPYVAAREVAKAQAAGFRIMAPGIVLNASEPYPYGWLTRYLEVGGPVPEAWHVHVYDCPTWDMFRRRVLDFRAWTYQMDVPRTIFVTETNAQDRHPREHNYLLQAIKADLALPVHQRVAESVAWFSNRYSNPWTGAPNKANLFEADDRRRTWVGDVYAHGR